MSPTIVALHRLPFDAQRFHKELECLDEDQKKQLEGQFRDNWENAWIVVVEWDGTIELDFGLFSHPDRGADSQAPWLEQVLESDGNMKRAAFFMHYVDIDKPLWYGETALKLPPVTATPQWLVERLEYSSPG